MALAEVVSTGWREKVEEESSGLAGVAREGQPPRRSGGENREGTEWWRQERQKKEGLVEFAR